MIKKLLSKLLKRPGELDFKQGFALTEVPIVTLYQGDNHYNFMLDTGSNDSIIDSNVIGQMIHKPVPMQSSLIGMEGNARIVDMCEVTLYFNERGYTYNYLINDMSSAFGQIKKTTGVNLHGIIGSKFFNQFKYVLDFEKLIAYSKK